MEDISSIIAAFGFFIGLPWLILHYVTRWKTAATLTTDDEALLDELYQLARRLEDRLETVERLVATDNPGFRTAQIGHDAGIGRASLRDTEELLVKRGRK